MNKPILSFSSGCVINLDDLDDFPDYFQVITKVLQSIKNNKLNESLMKTFLDAQLEDMQHIPEFRELIEEITFKYALLFAGKEALKGKLIIFLLKIAKNYFTSYSLQEQEARPILEILSKQLINHSVQFCDFWLSISRFAPYVEKHQQLIKLYLSVVNEEQIFKSEENSLFYIKSTDKILRFRGFRQAFLKIKNQLTKEENSKRIPFLNFKLTQYWSQENNKKQFDNFLNIVHKQNNSKFLDSYIKLWQEKLAHEKK